jgi:glycosyltransferase involved in cell wall biosynthesis
MTESKGLSGLRGALSGRGPRYIGHDPDAMEAVPTSLESPGAAAAQISIVVPVFNGARTLDELHRRVATTLSGRPGVRSWELILVNDGSADSSWERIVSLSSAYPEVRGLDLTQNYGQHNALLAGIHAARHEVIVTLDDDLQHPPEEIPKLLDALGPDLDVVYGAPIAKCHPAYRRIGATAVKAFLRGLTRRRAHLLSSGYRAFRADLTRQFTDDSGRRVVLDSLLRARTDRIGSIPVNHEPRRDGHSNYSVPMLVRFALTEIATELPLGVGNGRRGPSYGVRAVTESQSGGNGRR